MLFDTLKADRIQAMKNKEEVRKNLLGCVIAEASKEVKIPDDTKVLAVIKKFVQNAQDVIKLKDNPSSHEEIAILELYLPKQLTKEELATIIQTNGLVGVPVIMKFFKEKHQGCYDNATLAALAKGLT